MVGTSPTFPLVPRRRLIGLPFGGLHSARRGRGSDTAGSRPYRRGDDIHAIDWNGSARLSSARGADEFVVRERFAEEAPRVVVVLDRRPATALYPPPLPWLDKRAAIETAARAIAASASRVRGSVGTIEHGAHGIAWRHELRLETAPHRAPEDSLARVLDHLGRLRGRLAAGTFVFVLSDFLVDPGPAAWLAALERRWDVVPVVVQDPVWERSFPDAAGVVLTVRDPAGGRARRVRLSRREAAARREANEARWETLFARFRALGLEPVVLAASDEASVVRAFLAWADGRAAEGRLRW